MRRADINDLPNPFSIERLSVRPKTASLTNRLKFLALIAILLASSLLLGNQYTKYRFSRLSSDFAALSSPEKLDRLDQLSAWGDKAIPTIVAALGDQDHEVANHAHGVLRRLQNDWVVLEFDQTIRNQKALVDSIRVNESELTDERRKLAVDLLQRAAQLSVEQSSHPTRQLYFSATAAIDELSSTMTFATDDTAPSKSKEIDDRKRPLPVDHLAHGADWTDWPPRADVSFSAQVSVVQANAVQVSGPTSRPKIHRTNMSPLQAVTDGEEVVLHEVQQSRTHSVVDQRTGESMYDPPTTIQPVAHVIETPWQNANVATIIKFLGRPEQELRDQAETELTRRGLSEAEISIASQIAIGNTPSKVALIDSLSNTSDIDVRPWLMLLLDDRDREVRLRTISALAAIKDPWVQQQLKLKMVDEKDQTVAFRIRRVLNLR